MSAGSNMQPAVPTTTIDFKRLIELVRPHRYLYDRQEPEFKDVALKNHRWHIIGAEFGITGEHAAQKFRTMKTKYQDLKRMNQASRYYGKSLGRPRWRYYDLMDEFLRDHQISPVSSEAPAMVISNICSVAEQAAAVAVPGHEGLIVPEVWSPGSCVSDGPEKKKIKQEPQHDEVSWDTNDSVENQLEGESLGSNQVPGKLHHSQATPEDTADASVASTSAPSIAAGSQQDAFHYFGMMVADRLRRLPRGAALKALNAMHQVLFQHEMAADV